MDKVQFKPVVDKEQLRKAVFAFWRRGRIRHVYVAIVLLTLAFPAYWGLYGNGGVSQAIMFFVLVIGGTLAVRGPGFHADNVAQKGLTWQEAEGDSTMFVSQDGVGYRSERREWFLKWASFTRFEEVEEFFFLDREVPPNPLVLYKAWMMPPQVAAVREFLAASSLPCRKQPAKRSRKKRQRVDRPQAVVAQPEPPRATPPLVPQQGSATHVPEAMPIAPGLPLTCASCFGTFEGIPSHWRCPRCGVSLSRTLDLGVIDPAGTSVTKNVPCVRCGYNLRTLDLAADCPECGTGVARSASHDRLCSADPAWLRRMRRGLDCLILASLMPVLGPIAFMVCTMFVMLATGQRELELAMARPVFFYVVPAVLVLVFWLVGLLMTTVSGPLQNRGRRRVNPRVLARVCAVVLTALIILLGVRGWTLPVVWTMSVADMVLVPAYLALVAAVFALSMAGLGANLGEIAREAGRRDIAQFATQFVRAVLAFAAIVLLAAGLTGLVVFGVRHFVVDAAGRAADWNGAPDIVLPASGLIMAAVLLAALSLGLTCYVFWIILLLRSRMHLSRLLKTQSGGTDPHGVPPVESAKA